jgi:branched-chain amino acid transport system ATP-binding protein
MSALVLDHVMKRFGALRAADDVSLAVEENELHALIGPNGAGKTTLIGLITGELRADGGRIGLFGHDVTGWSVPRRVHHGLARSFQITTLCEGFTAEQNVALAVQAMQGHSFRFWRAARQDKSLRDPAFAALERVGLLARAGHRVEALSHGEKRQLELAVALATNPRLLLLDEPMAGMGPEESQRITALLHSLKGSLTLILIEHDMDAVFSLADRVSVLVSGHVIATGTAQDVRRDPAVRQAYLGAEAHAAD